MLRMQIPKMDKSKKIATASKPASKQDNYAPPLESPNRTLTWRICEQYIDNCSSKRDRPVGNERDKRGQNTYPQRGGHEEKTTVDMR